MQDVVIQVANSAQDKKTVLTCMSSLYIVVEDPTSIHTAYFFRPRIQLFLTKNINKYRKKLYFRKQEIILIAYVCLLLFLRACLLQYVILGELG